MSVTAVSDVFDPHATARLCALLENQEQPCTPDAVAQLLCARADPNFFSAVLSLSAAHVVNRRANASELFPLLVQHGMSLQSVDVEGRTVLAHRVRQCDGELLEQLLVLGADPNVVDDDGLAPLTDLVDGVGVSAKRGQRVLRALLAAGARYDVMHPHAMSITALVLENGGARAADDEPGADDDVVRDLQLLRELQVVWAPEALSLLMHAVQLPLPRSLEFLLEHGVVPPDPAASVRLLVMADGAAQVDILVRHGVVADAQLESGDTALHLNRAADIAAALLAAGADHRRRNMLGHTPLMACLADVVNEPAERKRVWLATAEVLLRHDPSQWGEAVTLAGSTRTVAVWLDALPAACAGEACDRLLALRNQWQIESLLSPSSPAYAL